jgi:polar amino acid transport system permease protein
MQSDMCDPAPDRLNARSRVRPSEVVLTIAVLLVAAHFVASQSTNKNFHWETFAQYLTAKAILSGISVTITLTVIATVVGLLMGTMLAAMWGSSYRPLRWLSWLFIWFSRGTPVLVHLLLWFNLALFFPTISIGIPYVHTFWEVPTNMVITSFTASVMGLSLSEASYMAEIVRGGLNAIDPGQNEAARALGLTPAQTLRSVLLPQAMRAIIPPISNQVILMLKTTSLVSVIAGNDLLTRAKDIYNDNFQVVPLLLVATFWYLVFTTVTTIGQQRLEAYYSKGVKRRPAPKNGQR